MPPVEAELLDLQWDQEPLPDAHEIIDGLFVGNADAAVEATTGPNSHGIGFILDVAGCVTPAVFAALAAALSEEHNSDADESEPSPLINCKTARAQAFSLNGIETVSIPLDDHGRTHLSEDRGICHKHIAEVSPEVSRPSKHQLHSKAEYRPHCCARASSCNRSFRRSGSTSSKPAWRAGRSWSTAAWV